MMPLVLQLLDLSFVMQAGKVPAVTSPSFSAQSWPIVPK